MVHLYPRRPTFGLHMPFWTLVGQLGISNSFYFYLNAKWIFHVIFMYYHLTFIFKGKGSNMPLNYSKGLDIPPFKVWSIYTLASKLLVYICPYGCLLVNSKYPTHFTFFKCQMGFHIIYIYYHLTFILKEKGAFYAPNYPT